MSTDLTFDNLQAECQKLGIDLAWKPRGKGPFLTFTTDLGPFQIVARVLGGGECYVICQGTNGAAHVVHGFVDWPEDLLRCIEWLREQHAELGRALGMAVLQSGDGPVLFDAWVLENEIPDHLKDVVAEALKASRERAKMSPAEYAKFIAPSVVTPINGDDDVD